jgi:hypothetical protein
MAVKPRGGLIMRRLRDRQALSARHRMTPEALARLVDRAVGGAAVRAYDHWPERSMGDRYRPGAIREAVDAALAKPQPDRQAAPEPKPDRPWTRGEIGSLDQSRRRQRRTPWTRPVI